MKKLISLIILFVLVFSLGACNSASDDYATKSDLELIQEQILELETRLNNLTVVEGINGQKSYYENQALADDLNEQLLSLSTTIERMTDTFDPYDKAPNYIKDDFGTYVSFNDLGKALKFKYFEDSTVGVSNVGGDEFDNSDNAKLRFTFISDMTKDEVFAKTVLLIEELSNYEFYFIDCTTVIVTVLIIDDLGEVDQFTITIKSSMLLNDIFVIGLDSIYYNDFEIDFNVQGVSYEQSQLYYDSAVLSAEFDGYVLNFIGE